jgi:hypothetical protein
MSLLLLSDLFFEQGDGELDAPDKGMDSKSTFVSDLLETRWLCSGLSLDRVLANDGGTFSLAVAALMFFLHLWGDLDK